jgi:hypothetical protein
MSYMKNNLVKVVGATLVLSMGLFSCTKDLKRFPTNAITSDSVYSSLAGYKQALAKVYSAYAVTSSNGPNSSDLGGIDAGTSDFLRLWWNAQELSTDEAICAWNDPGVPDFHNMNWAASNTILGGLYSRCLYQITICNDFIRNSTDAAIKSHGISDGDASMIKNFRAEARFLRAFQYWVLMDLFANPPFVTENDPVGGFLPPQKDRAFLFNYVESELKGADSSLLAPKTNEYGRADQAAEWALLARLYLNAEVYLGTGKGRYSDAITYASKVISAGYQLHPVYKNLFMGDNYKNNPEEILSINYNGINTQNWGGTTFLINGALNSDLNPAAFGVPNGGWGGNRATANLPKNFGDYSGNGDHRAMFGGSKITIDNVSTFTDGLAVLKWSNLNSDGTTPPSANGVFCSTNFPLFRLAESYLIYAEAVVRGGSGGDMPTAIGYINLLRERGYGNTNGNLGSIALTDVLNERQRELYWEAFRRTDLIRFGYFTSGTYLWPWKGGVPSGTGVDVHFNIYPIPSTDLTVNPNLVQNPGY